MASSIDLSRAEYASIEQTVDALIFLGRTRLTADDIMQKIDVILQSVLFCAAIEDGVYYDGESGFLCGVVRHTDILTQFNRSLGKTLKKPLTWDGLVFLPAPAKRQMTEALRDEADKAMTALRRALGKEDLMPVKERLLKIADFFSGIDLEQKGSAAAKSEQDACRRRLDVLFGTD